ncbi:hypothetical protein EQM14_11095 [Caproiciproducens sp. NJN-50]|uniref:hypothetical protein n=1 Tax=Acutalibacteraceae TaxID=3082771 RepID=UPI000FFE08E2|nr:MULTISPECIES: hypothetical protein [Acutalibacteraceae]QAT50263.1 hypothetical protein EQM14_11095 [Caproiciproducens sp. NJN-50]
MRKQYRILSMVLALTLVVSMFTGNMAFAEETGLSVISLHDFASVTTIEKHSRTFYEIEIDQPEVTLEAASSDESVLKTSLTEESEDSGYYTLVLEAYSEGEATVTLTASDGTAASRQITVQDTGYEWDYTADADQTGDFTVPSGNSRYIKIHYENLSAETYTFPTLVSDHPDDVAVTLEGYEDNDYYYRVDALGNDGRTASLYIGSSDYVIARKLCGVSIAKNSDLSMDTRSTYVCSVFDTYHFVVHTKSGTAPEVTAYNDNITITPVGKVEGGYEYVMEAEHEGESLVQATLNGETAAFAVSILYDDPPSVVYDEPKEVSVERGQTYTYKFSIMGGGTPSFAPDQAGAFTVQSVRKDGIDYYCTVAATGAVGSSSSLLVSFPDSDESYTVNAGKVTVAKQVSKILESDTNHDFSLAKGSSYLFKITGASSFYAGSSGMFTISKEKTSGKDTYYRITATGKVGEAAGFYMYAPGCVPLKVCAVTVAPVKITSDTSHDFELPAGGSYQFKITAPGVDSIQFNGGSAGIVQPVLVKHSGNDFYYKVTAVGKPGQQTGIYASVLGQDAVKICVVTVGQIKVLSDTNGDFSLAAGASYQFKITARGASYVDFGAGSSGVVQTSLVKHSGDDFYFKVTGKGASGQKTGIYVAAPNQDSKKVCVITIK